MAIRRVPKHEGGVEYVEDGPGSVSVSILGLGPTTVDMFCHLQSKKSLVI